MQASRSSRKTDGTDDLENERFSQRTIPIPEAVFGIFYWLIELAISEISNKMVIPAGQEKIGTRAFSIMVNYSVVVNNPVGLHARPAADFVKTANQFASSVKVRNATRGTALINGKSMLKVLTLGAEKGHELEIEFEGEDEQAAFQAIQALFDSNFGE